MKQIDITNKNKDLDLRRFGKNEYTKDINSQSGMGGESSIDFENTSLEDLFTASITRGQYLRYEDVPVMKEGENPGYSREVPGTEIYAEDDSNRYYLVFGYNTIWEIFKDTVGFNSGGGK